MEAINYAPDGQNMILTDDAQIVPGISGNACYLPAGTGTIALQGNRNELSLSLWRQWDGIVEQYAPRGLFSFENIQVFFDSVSDFLTVVINDFKTMTDIKDDQKQAHWCFTFVKNGRFTVYKNAKEVYSLVAGNKPVDMTDGFTLGGGFTHATFDEVRIYKTVLTQGEINGLFYLISKGTQVKQLESMIPAHTPKYLGVTKTVLTTRTAFIIKGEKLGTQDANPGDWVLMDKTVGGWKCGVCYRWTGSMWINLEPEYNYIEQYQAALYHICEIPELMQNTGHFGALFAKVLVAQKALIDKLVAQEAFINKLVAQEAFIKQLATEQAFLKKLIVQKLHIDSDPNSHQDFEAWFDETNGLKINNKGQEIFKVDTAGNVFAKNATFKECILEGIVNAKGLNIVGFKGGNIFLGNVLYEISGGIGVASGVKYKSPGTGEFKFLLQMRDSSTMGVGNAKYYIKVNNNTIFNETYPQDGKIYKKTIYINVSFGDEVVLTAEGGGRISSLSFMASMYIDTPNTILSFLSKWERF